MNNEHHVDVLRAVFRGEGARFEVVERRDAFRAAITALQKADSPRRETFDPQAVRELLEILENLPQPRTRALLDAILRVRESEKK